MLDGNESHLRQDLLRKMLARRKCAGVGRLGRDLEEVAAGHTGKGLGKLRGLAAGGK